MYTKKIVDFFRLVYIILVLIFYKYACVFSALYLLLSQSTLDTINNIINSLYSFLNS